MGTQQEEREMTTENKSIAGQQAATFVEAATNLPTIPPEAMAIMFAAFVQQMMQQPIHAPTPVLNQEHVARQGRKGRHFVVYRVAEAFTLDVVNAGRKPRNFDG